MNWRNSVTSPNGYRYFLQIFHSLSEVTSYSNPSWFDTSRMGNIFLLYVNGVLTLVGADGPETETAWLGDLGYPVGDIPVVAYTLSFAGVEHGTVDGYVNSFQVESPVQVVPGAEVMLIVGAEAGYTINEWTGLPEGAIISGNVATFQMPSENVSVSVTFSVIPVTVNNLCVVFDYNGTTTHLAFVRDSTLDRYRSGVFMYAWTIATTQWTIIYTDTLDCQLNTSLWIHDESTDEWSISTAVIEDPIWTTKVSFIIENNATVVGTQQIMVEVDSHTYSNAEESFLAFRCNSLVDAVITILVEHDWVWADTGTMITPRTVNVADFGNTLVINNS